MYYGTKNIDFTSLNLEISFQFIAGSIMSSALRFKTAGYLGKSSQHLSSIVCVVPVFVYSRLRIKCKCCVCSYFYTFSLLRLEFNSEECGYYTELDGVELHGYKRTGMSVVLPTLWKKHLGYYLCQLQLHCIGIHLDNSITYVFLLHICVYKHFLKSCKMQLPSINIEDYNVGATYVLQLLSSPADSSRPRAFFLGHHYIQSTTVLCDNMAQSKQSCIQEQLFLHYIEITDI